ncbi:Hypothetical predicted protein [Mytilus galloprovincialis]|uniref:Uncharacterized protein n=1 Tax=Mytilus galloprovincialis TaxID=29158 RepID=A0A8B6CG25_MYTGA|nr:Hypothetical predicted protein [Mytilus galloprovincialis]
MQILHLSVLFALVLGYDCLYYDQYSGYNSNYPYQGLGSSRNNYGRLECIRKCKASKTDYWQRFCPNKRTRLHCDNNYSIKIKTAKYGSFPCHPTNKQFKGYIKCQIAPAKVLAHTKAFCENQRECTGHASRTLFGKLALFYQACAKKHKLSFYAEYQCIPSKSFCGAYCKCRSASPIFIIRPRETTQCRLL